MSIYIHLCNVIVAFCMFHILYALRLIVLLSIALSCIASHGFIPPSFIKSIIIPLLKDKSGDITNTNNYMPIAISTVSSKLFEHIILERYEEYFTTTDNQFGF